MKPIIDIEIEKIEPHKNNRQYGGFNNARLEELAESIKSHGVLQPLIVRRQKDRAEYYELVAGERRWRASMLAGKKDVPCSVRDLTDMDALKIRAIENLQREDLHPLDELSNYEELIGAGYKPAQIAHEIGRSTTYVYERLRLSVLHESCLEALKEKKITLSHALLIARLPKELHEKALPLAFGYQKELRSVDDFKMLAEQELYLKLENAAWGLDDEKLYPEAGACRSCSKRSGASPELFPELHNSDRCFDADCFKGKQDAMVERQREALKDTEHIEVMEYPYSETEQEQGAEQMWNYEEVEEGTEGAKTALKVSGPEKGKVVHVKNKYEHQSYEETPEEREEREAASRKWEIDRKANLLVAETIREELCKDMKVFMPQVLEAHRFFIFLLLGNDLFNLWGYDTSDALTAAGIDTKELAEKVENDSEAYGKLLYEKLCALPFETMRTLATDILSDYATYDNENLGILCDMLGLNLEGIQKESRELAELEYEEEQVKTAT